MLANERGASNHVTRALHSAGIANVCPQPLRLFSDIEAVNGDVLISTWLHGEPLSLAPAADARLIWQAILNSLAQIHSLTPAKTEAEILPAVAAVRHPEDMLAVVRTRLSYLQHRKSGFLEYEQIAHLVDVLHQQVPHRWETEPPLTLVHSDSHPANMILHEGQIAFVDWEGAGWSDPAFDISNMTTNWRYADLPQSHHQWLHQTFADMTNDSTLSERVRIYAMIQTVHWVINYSNFILNRADNRPQGVHRFSIEFELKQQKYYWQRARELFPII